MVFSIPPVKHVTQHGAGNKGRYYCGPASVQMVLRAYTGNMDSLATLYGDKTHDDTMGWGEGSYPDGVAFTIQKRVGSPLKKSFKKFSATTEEALSRKICWAIAHHQKPTVVLIHWKSHWIVANGCQISRNPTSADDGGYDIDYIFINDPANERAANSPTEQIYEVVAYAEWPRSYLGLPVPIELKDCPDCEGFIAIIDVDAPGDFPPYVYHSANDGVAVILTPAEAVAAAQTIIDSSDLFSNYDPWKQLKGNITPFMPLKEVEYGRPDDESYLIGYQLNSDVNNNLNVVLKMRIGAYDGLLRSSLAAGREGYIHVGDGLLHKMPPNEVIPHFKDIGIVVPSNETTYFPIDVLPGTEPPLTWRPCLESLTPYLPFYEIQARTADPQAETVTIYLRLDGVAFLELTNVIGG